VPGGPESSHPKLLAREQGQQFSCPQEAWPGHKWREELSAPDPFRGSIAALGVGGCIRDSCPVTTTAMVGDARGPICPGLETVNLQWGKSASAGAWPARCPTLLQFTFVLSLSTLVGVLGQACTGGTSSLSKRGNPVSRCAGVMPRRLKRLLRALLPRSAQAQPPHIPPSHITTTAEGCRAPPPPVLLQLDTRSCRARRDLSGQAGLGAPSPWHW